MKKHIRLAYEAVFFAMITVALTGCGVKSSYTSSSTVETAESKPLESESQTENEAEKVTKPIEFENGRYYAVKDKDSERTVDEVKVHGADGDLYIEYGAKKVAVPWARTDSEAAADRCFYLQDVTGDGNGDLIGIAENVGIRSAVFVYDLKNEKDLSPYYCVRHNLDDGLYTKDEYASLINEELKKLTDESGETPIDMSCMRCLEPIASYITSEETEDGFFEDGVLRVTYGGLIWHCTVEYDFTDGECNMRIAETETQYSRLKEIFDVHGENILEVKELSYNKVVITNEDIEITVTSTYFSGNGRVILKYKDWAEERDIEEWYFNYDSDKVYFELYDYDGDGNDELLYHTVTDGEDEVLVYEFE